MSSVQPRTLPSVGALLMVLDLKFVELSRFLVLDVQVQDSVLRFREEVLCDLFYSFFVQFAKGTRDMCIFLSSMGLCIQELNKYS